MEVTALLATSLLPQSLIALAAAAEPTENLLVGQSGDRWIALVAPRRPTPPSVTIENNDGGPTIVATVVTEYRAES